MEADRTGRPGPAAGVPPDQGDARGRGDWAWTAARGNGYHRGRGCLRPAPAGGEDADHPAEAEMPSRAWDSAARRALGRPRRWCRRKSFRCSRRSGRRGDRRGAGHASPHDRGRGRVEITSRCGLTLRSQPVRPDPRPPQPGIRTGGLLAGPTSLQRLATPCKALDAGFCKSGIRVPCKDLGRVTAAYFPRFSPTCSSPAELPADARSDSAWPARLDHCCNRPAGQPASNRCARERRADHVVLAPLHHGGREPVDPR